MPREAASIVDSPANSPSEPPSGRLIAHNVRRLMAQAGMKYDDLVTATGLDARTIRGIVRNNQAPRPKTLSRLAEGLGVTTDELFAPPTGLTPEAFDAATNPVVEHVKASRPEVFQGWSPDDYAELASRFGVGGQLTEQGTLDAAEHMNHVRQVLQQAKVVLETSRGQLLVDLIDVLYREVTLEE